VSSETRPVERLRLTPLLTAAAVMQLAAIVLYAVNATHQQFSPFWGWLPAISITFLTAFSCWHAARTAGLAPVPARLWRSITLVLVLVGLGTIGDARQSVVDPLRITQQQHDLPTSICYAASVGVLLWTLLRLPTAVPNRRFFLDALTIGVTAGVFAWYFTTVAVADGDARRTTVPMLMMAVLGLIVALALA
jgi:Trk-type K+ transport system membrane component